MARRDNKRSGKFETLRRREVRRDKYQVRELSLVVVGK